MKISPYDKVQSFKRSKKYRKDYLQYVEERSQEGVNDFFVYGEKTGEWANVLSKSGKRLCEKWKIRSPVNPDTKYVTGEEACVHAPVTYLDLPEEWKRITYSGGKDGRNESITHINGKLVLMIDTAYSAAQIKAEIEKPLCYWTRETTNRSKPSKKVDIWQIYDEVEGGKTQYQIAQKYAAKQTKPGLPVYLTDTQVKLIRDSYQKAQNIIRAVEKRNQTVIPIDPMEDRHIEPTRNK
jgi:hypothetical protein